MSGIRYSGAGWIKSNFKLESSISPLGETVADLLGDVFLGIYHLSSSALKKVEWSNPRFISFVYFGNIATVDDNALTRLLVLAHDRLVRVEITGAANKYLRILFHQRHNRSGSEYWDRCPGLDHQISTIRDHYGSVSLDAPKADPVQVNEEGKQ